MLLQAQGVNAEASPRGLAKGTAPVPWARPAVNCQSASTGPPAFSSDAALGLDGRFLGKPAFFRPFSHKHSIGSHLAAVTWRPCPLGTEGVTHLAW